MVLLDKIGWMERVNIISSASGGSITNAFFVATKAKFYSDHQMTFNQENFLDKFYRPLKAFLESDEVTNAILSDVGGQDKIIKKAAFCYEEYLKEILDSVDSTEIIEDIWQLLERNNTSPDCLSINATDMTDANLFRFAILRTQNTNHGLILGNTFFDLSKMENNNPKLKNYLQTLKIGDTIAASSCFPIGFEPMIFPDDFFTGDCLQEGLENQKSVALMDGGLYDNLALTSLESLRPNSKNQEITLSGQIDLVIVTDADNLEPSRALLDPEKLKEVNESHSSAQQLSRFQKILSWLTKVGIKLVDYIIKIFKG
ncbi:MAG: patatin-like phospholipase family protein, partial [Microcystaceae cyanobacterium]